MEWAHCDTVAADLATDRLQFVVAPDGRSVHITGILEWCLFQDATRRQARIDVECPVPPQEAPWDQCRVFVPHPVHTNQQPRFVVLRSYDRLPALGVDCAHFFRVGPNPPPDVRVTDRYAYHIAATWPEEFQGPERDGVACHWEFTGHGRLGYLHKTRGRIMVRWGPGEPRDPDYAHYEPDRWAHIACARHPAHQARPSD